MIRAYYVSLHGANEKKIMATSPQAARKAYARLRKLTTHIRLSKLKVRLPKLQACKDGKDRRGKTVASLRRYEFRQMFWIPLRDELRLWCAVPNMKSNIARMVGVSPSQIHRYTCPKCEHDQEPPFSTAMAIMCTLKKLDYDAEAILTISKARRVHV